MADQMLKDKDYDLISVIYNASQAAEVCRQYMEDAQREGDADAQRFFQDVMNKNMTLIQEGKNLLKTRLH